MSCSLRGIRNGTNGTAGFVVAAEARAMGPVESGAVAQRYWPEPWQACRINLWCAVLERRHSALGEEAVRTLAICARARRDIPRISRRVIDAEDCHATRPRTVNGQSGGWSEPRLQQIPGGEC